MNRFIQFAMLIAALGLLAPARAPAIPPSAPDPALAKLKSQLDDDDVQLARAPGFVFAGKKVDEQQFQDMVKMTTTLARPLCTLYFNRRPNYQLTVFLFNDHATYAAYAKKLFNIEVGDNNTGYYFSRRKTLLATTPSDRAAQQAETVFVHEFTHALMDADFPAAPVWLKEGMATLFEIYELNGDDIRCVSSRRLDELKTALTDNKTLSLADLLAADAVKFHGENAIAHYAQARYLCLFMQEKDLLRDFYRNFRDGSSVDKTGAKTMEKIFKSSLKDIETDWLRFIEDQK